MTKVENLKWCNSHQVSVLIERGDEAMAEKGAEECPLS
jgi:hypothetical protein